MIVVERLYLMPSSVEINPRFYKGKKKALARVFDHSKKCFQDNGNFWRKAHTFCAAVVNEKRLLGRPKNAPL